MNPFKRLARLGGLTRRVAGRALDRRVRKVLGGGDDDEGSEELARTAEDVTRTLSQLKGAAMKAGQQMALAASNLDLPEEVQQRLSRLHADGEPVPFETVRGVIEAELDGSLDDLFATFDPEPLGSASLGQAHAATLSSGREVVVKVLHEGVAEGLETDLLALRGLMLSGRLMGRHRDELRDIYDEVATHLRQELDYYQEAANIETFARLLGDDERFVVPSTVPSYCTERVLTMDRLPGRPLDAFVDDASDAARQRAGEHLAAWFFESTFHHRVLHADPHPGNYLFVDDGRLAVLDFGCVKRFDEFFLGAYARVVLAALDDDRAAALEAAVDLGVWDGEDPDAGDAIWDFCDAILAPWRDGVAVIGAGDDLVERVAPAGRRLWRFPQVRGARDMVYLHRTLGGLYSIARRLRVEGDWGAVLRHHLEHAVAVAEGRAPDSTASPLRQAG